MFFLRLLPWATPLEGATEVEDGSEKPGFNEELSRCEGYRVGTGGGWRNQAAANYLGPSRALPADCFSCGWIFGSARCGWERVATLWGLSSGSESEGHKLLGLPYQVSKTQRMYHGEISDAQWIDSGRLV